MDNNSKYSNYFAEKLRKQRRLKFGAVAVLLTAAVIAVVVVVNAIFSALATRFSWYIDMTQQQFYDVSQTTLDLLEDYRHTESFEIKIIFCSYEPEIKKSYYGNMVHQMAKQFESEFEFVSVEYIDLVNHPDAADKYLFTSVSEPNADSVIITNGTQSRLLSLQTFFPVDDSGNIAAFSGEYRFAVSILQLAGNSPIAYFVTGHGEDIKGTTMAALFEDAGFEVREIDLSKETPDEDAKVMVINNPKYDYMGDSDSVNEIKKIDRFLNGFGGLMVFLDAESKEMPELETFLAEWGIAFEKQTVRDYENSLSVDGKELVAEYTTTGTGASLTAPLRELENPPKVIVKNAKPIKLLYDADTVGSSDRSTSVILQTSSDKTAEAIALVDGETVATKGIYNLMTVTVDKRYIENEAHRSFVLAAGTSSFADDKYIGSASYGNRDIIFTVMKNFIQKTVPLGLDYDYFETDDLLITKGDANRWSVVCVIAFPILVCGVGIFVYTRRRYL